MILDFHTHVFPETIRKRPEAFFGSEPEFALLYDTPKARMAGAAELVAVMDAEGVDRSVIFGFPWRSRDLFRRHNDYVQECVQRFPDRLIGFGCFDCLHPEAAAETRRCLEAGMAGIGELAIYGAGIDAEGLRRMRPMMALCREAGVPVLIHTNEPLGHPYPGKTPNTLAQIFALVERFAENHLVLAHWGGGVFFYNLLKKQVPEKLRNVYFDTAASPFLYDPAIYSVAAAIIGPEKILLGSDFPLIRPGRYLQEIRSSGLGETDIRGICGQNAAALLALETA
jgi:predicted TIM-barrel fold metal-dependent hydrolase